MPPAPFPERARLNHRLQLGHGFGVPAQGQPRADPVLGSEVVRLGEPGCRGHRPRLIGELGQRVTMPQRESGLQLRRGGCGLAARQVVMRLPSERLEPERIHLVVRDAQHVPGVLGDQHPGGRARRPVRLEHPAQLGDVGLDRRGGSSGGLVPPQQVDQPVHRDDMPGLRQQDRQQGTLQPCAKVDLPAIQLYPERAQHGELQPSAA